MIKTHKPRGYFWTHASAFQLTKEYRTICYDECLAPTSEALALRSDETRSEAQHARKRRRIEKLADDFLNGEPLIISSARPCPSALKSSIVWNQRSSTQPKFELPDAKPADHSSPIWQDAEDDGDILRRFRSHRQDKRTDAMDITREADSNPEDQERIASRAAVPTLRRPKLANMTAGPSEEALRKAASLRARRVQRKESEAQAVPHRDPDSGRRLRSSDKRREPQPSNQWISRRPSASTFTKLDSNEESFDELRLSRIETPSNPPKGPQSSALSQSVAQLAISRQSVKIRVSETDLDTIAVTPRANEPSNLSPSDPHDSETSIPAGDVSHGCLDHNSYHTAPEETEIRSEEDGLEDESESQDDSQTRLLRSHGFKGASPTSWKSVNQRQTPLLQVKDTTREDVSGQSLNYTPLNPQPTERRTRRAAAANSETFGSRTENTTRDPRRRRVGKQVIYTNGQPLANDSSPFKWRRKVTFPSSDEIVVGPRRQEPHDHRHKGVSQSAPVTPAATGNLQSSDLRTSSPKVDAARSSPVLTSLTPATEARDISAARQSLPETWIGTQAMLYQAQRDLITSPEKASPTAESVDNQPPDDLDNAPNPASQQSGREPLKQLSQEPMPSTQQVLGEFVGFSTVKKPRRGGPRESLDSPSVLLRMTKAVSEPGNNEPSGGLHELPQKQKSRQSSSLRFSIDSVDSPLHSTNVDRPPSTTTPVIRRGADWSSTNIATSISKLKKSNQGNAVAKTPPLEGRGFFGNEDAQSEEESHLPSFSTAAPLPSFQAGQRWSSLPREDSNIDRTIEELTTELLNTRDMEGVLSQIG